MRIKSFCLCFAVVLATYGGAVAEVSAAPEHIYMVEGKKLEAGEKKEIKAKLLSGDFTIKGSETILGTKIPFVIECKKFKLNAAEKPLIVGGNPGTSEKEKFEFEECEATLDGTKCGSVTIETVKVNNELVTIIHPATKNGKLANWFVPASGGVFWTIKVKSCGIFGSHEWKVEGSTAAAEFTEKTEKPVQYWEWNEGEEITEIERQSGSKFSIGLKSAGNTTTLNGQVEVELVSKEMWGGF
jgi:hypothetical protein